MRQNGQMSASIYYCPADLVVLNEKGLLKTKLLANRQMCECLYCCECYYMELYGAGDKLSIKPTVVFSFHAR